MQFYTILDSLCVLSSSFCSIKPLIEKETCLPLLQSVIHDTVALLDDVQAYRDNVNVSAAKYVQGEIFLNLVLPCSIGSVRFLFHFREGDKTKLLKDFTAFPKVTQLMKEVRDVSKSLDDLRPEIAQRLSLFSTQYTCVSGQEYLIEVKNTNVKCVPENWKKISRLEPNYF